MKRIVAGRCRRRPDRPWRAGPSRRRPTWRGCPGCPREPPTPPTPPGERQPVHLSAAQAQAIGVTYTVVQRGPLARTVRTVGQVVPAESGLADITAEDRRVRRAAVRGCDRTSGPARATAARALQPDARAAQEELLTAQRLAADDRFERPARPGAMPRTCWRPRGADSPIGTSRPEQIERLERTGEVTKTLTLTAPFDGVVLEKMVVAGQAVMAGDEALPHRGPAHGVDRGRRCSSRTWRWSGSGAAGASSSPRIRAARLPGRVSFVWPVVDAQSRSGARTRGVLQSRRSAQARDVRDAAASMRAW